MKITKILLVCGALFCCVDVNAEPTNPRILVAYYSLTGKTEQVAQAIAAASGGELYRIEVAKSYPSDAKERRAILNAEIEENFLPPLKATMVNPGDFDIIFLGSPVWANHLSLPVKSFLVQYNLAGNHVIPFVTHSGGGKGQSFNDVAELCTDCVVDMDGWSNWGGGTGRRLNNWVQNQLAEFE